MPRTARRLPALLALVLALVAALTLGGCANYPKDPDKTLERIRQNGVIRVGASQADGLTDITGDEPAGPEADFVRDFARSIGARIEWHKGGEEALMETLEADELDLVIGGLTKDSPWSEKAALTRPWRKTKDAHGKDKQYVIAAPLGENALVSQIERFIDSREGQQ